MVDLIERTKPTEAGLTAEWTPEARQEVLGRVLAGEVPRMRSGRRAWPAAVAASLLAGLMLAPPAALPGWFFNTAAAEELAGVARAARELPPLEWVDGQFLRVRTIETQDRGSLEPGSDAAEEEFGPDGQRRVTYDDFHTTDGWTWSDRLVNGASERYIFPPGWGWTRPDYAAGMPTEAHLLDVFLRARVLGSTSQDEAVFVAIGDMLKQEAAPPSIRAAAIGVLGLNPKVTVHQGDDPEGREALTVTFTDEAQRPGMSQHLYLDRETGVLLASAIDYPEGHYQRVVTSREVVDSLPADLAAALGTEKTGKAIMDGQTTIIPDNAGPDPVPVPEQTYTPAPKR